jgi:hypothetical protein
VERTPNTKIPSDRRSRAVVARQYRAAVDDEIALAPPGIFVFIAMLAFMFVLIIVNTNYRSLPNESIRKHAPNHFSFVAIFVAVAF